MVVLEAVVKAMSHFGADQLGTMTEIKRTFGDEQEGGTKEAMRAISHTAKQ